MPAMLTSIEIKFLFSVEELGKIRSLRDDPQLNQLLRILDDPNFANISNEDKIFVDGVNLLKKLGVLSAARKTRVLSGLRPE